MSDRPIIGLLIALATAACPPLAPATPCADDGECPPGQRCDKVRSYCYLPPATAAGDAAIGDGHASDRTATDAGAAERPGTDASALERPGADAGAGDHTPADGAMDLGAWSWRRRLTFDNSAASEPLLHFPVLVTLDSTRIEYDVAAADGTDLRFVDGDGQTLPYEVERWDSAGQSQIWVEVPQIDAASTTDHIWMYYGNPGAPPGARPAATWNNGFEAVYHLDDSLIDSVTDQAATSHGTAASAGRIGLAQQFYGSPTWIHIGSDRPLLRNVTQATLSGWAMPAALPDDSFLVAVSIHDVAPPSTRTRASVDFYYSQVQMTSRAADSETDGHYTYSPVGSIVSGTWSHVVGVFDYDGWQHIVYINGVEVARESVTLTQHATSDTNATNSSIGAEDDGSRCYFDGLIDEVRIAHVARSAAWIAAEHYNQRDPGDTGFVRYSARQTP